MPRLVAVYARRFEPDWLVNDMIANISPWVDDVVCVDDRGRPRSQGWGHEGNMRVRQRQAAVDAGADWVLMIDPDERIEDRAGSHIRHLIANTSGRVIYRLRLRELFTPTAYRVDGKWGLFWRGRLWPVLPGQRMSGKAIHAAPCPVNKDHRRLNIDVNLYHVKMIEPANRLPRARAYARAETEHGARRRNWARMRTTAGMRLQPIPRGRGYSPAYSRPYLIGAS